MARRSLPKRLWYGLLQVLCQLAAVSVFHIRCQGRALVPARGGAMVLSNHQSHLDPVLVGLACNRRMNYLARQTLFRVAPLRWLMKSLDAISLDREGTGLGGLKETLKRLKREEIVLIFPEGTRTQDGDVARLKPGFCALAKRAAVPLVPVAIEGAFAAWPRWRRWPWPTVIHVVFGPPLLPDRIAVLPERELVDEMQRRICDCHRRAQASRQAVASSSAQRRMPYQGEDDRGNGLAPDGPA